MCVDALLTLATGTVVLALTVSEVTSTRGPRYYEPDFISERRTMHRDPRPADATLLCTERQFVGWQTIGSELIDAQHGLALHLLNPGRILLAILPMAEASPGRTIIL